MICATTFSAHFELPKRHSISALKPSYATTITQISIVVVVVIFTIISRRP
jgi:hypothetical protein